MNSAISEKLLSEKLQETLFELNRVEEREKKFKEENKAILTAISAMSGAKDKVEVFNTLLKVIEGYVTFENALVLTRNEDTQGKFTCLVSTNAALELHEWQGKDMFSRCVHGQTIVLYAPENILEFKSLNIEEPICYSALISGVMVNENESILLLLSSKKWAFGTQTKKIIEHFRPLIERTIIDIDYRERLQCLVSVKTQELAASRQRFRDFAKTASDWFWELDNKYELSHLSSPLEENYTIKPQAIFQQLKKQPEVKRKILRFMKEKKSFSDIECTFFHKDTEMWISLSGLPFYDKKNICLGYRGTGKDITDRKCRLQELQQARKQAESANAAKSQFLAMMSHEIRTPLNAVMGLLDVMEQSPLNKEQSILVNQMDKSAQLLLTIINDVLDLSRIESDNFELYPENINPRDSIYVVYDQLHELCVRKQINLKLCIDNNVPNLIFQDENRFIQILLNLVGNSVKFTKKGEIRISMMALNDVLQIEIKDTGIGIDSKNRQDIFKPFTQANSSVTREYGGTGLGLSICTKLLAMMNGTIELSSEIDVGTTFIVKIPLTEPVKVQQETSNEEEQEPLQALNILVAEDSIANQMVVQLILEKAGHNVVVVNNGQEAIDSIKSNDVYFDLIFMDMSMPILCGIEATKKLRAEGCQLPIIALTANAMNEDKDKCLDAGMNDFVTKPIRAATLKTLLSKFKPHCYNQA